MTTDSRHISRLRISHFRNYTAAALDLDDRNVVLTGANGAGKTNLIEAISLLSPGRGLRRALFEDLVQVGTDDPWAVAATIETGEGPADVGTGEAPGEGGRRVRINGANARTIEEISQYLRILWLTPSMDGLFTGPASDRRRFLDRLVTALIPSHGANVSNYEKAMRHRNKLIEGRADPGWLDAVEAQMAEAAAAIHFSRIDSLGHLQALVLKNIDPGAFPAAELRLTAMGVEPGASSHEMEAQLQKGWAEGRERDRAAGRTLAGPHRADLEVVHAQKRMPAALCSTGEQKALLIGLVLAHARVVESQAGIAPFLLLDEVAAHLDPGRRAALFTLLSGMGGQCFMTGTDPVLFSALDQFAQKFHVADGMLSRLA